MAYGLETAGGIVGDLVGRGNAALQQGGTYGAAGFVGGGTVGALAGTAGVVTGPGEAVIEPAAIGTGAAIGGAGGLAYGAASGLIQGTPGFADQGAEYGRRLSDWITQMTSAEARAKARQKTVTTALDQACATCGCSALANGIPGTPYRGGAHAFMQQKGLQSHHMPPAAVSPLPTDEGPAIQMDRTDHYQTPSYGRNIFAPFMQTQGKLANTGQFQAAFEADAAAVEKQYPGKYTGAIQQARAYSLCLQKAGIVK